MIQGCVEAMSFAGSNQEPQGASLTPASPQDRSCGSCTLCCKVYPIEALDKRRNALCVHCTPGRGCGNYEERPPVCRDFLCLWLQDPSLGEEWKPDISHMVIALRSTPATTAIQVTVDPAYPLAWQKAPYLDQMVLWAQAVTPDKRYVVIFEGETATVLLPDRPVDLGATPDGETFNLDFWQEDGRWEVSFYKPFQPIHTPSVTTRKTPACHSL